MPGLSSRQPVSGAYGVGKVHLKFVPRKKRTFPFGLLLYFVAILFAACAWSWSKRDLKFYYLIPVLRHGLSVFEGFRLKPFDEVMFCGVDEDASISMDESSNYMIKSLELRDAMFTQGFLHATERLFQMDTLRRLALGRLSEIYGNEKLLLDKFSRTFNFYGLAVNDKQSLGEYDKSLLESYSNGINHYLTKYPHQLPSEYLFLKLNSTSIFTWTPEHTLSILRFLGMLLSHGGEEELTRAYLLQSFGEDITRELLQTSSQEGDSHASLDLKRAYTPSFAPSAGGQAWILPRGLGPNSGHRHLVAEISTQASLLTTLMDLTIVTDSGYEGAGVSLPGVPLLLQGRNGALSWALTCAPVDTEDLFIEHVLHDPSAPHHDSYNNSSNQYRYLLHWDGIEVEGSSPHQQQQPSDSEETDTGAVRDSPSTGSYPPLSFRDEEGAVWSQMTVRVETIPVRNSPAHHDTVLETARGPVVDKLLNGDGATAAAAAATLARSMSNQGVLRGRRFPPAGATRMTSLRSQALRQHSGAFEFLRMMNLAATSEDVRQAAATLEAIPLNVVYSVSDGTGSRGEGAQGYFVTGRVPARALDQDGSVPTDVGALSHSDKGGLSGWAGEMSTMEFLGISSLRTARSEEREARTASSRYVISTPIHTKPRLEFLLSEHYNTKNDMSLKDIRGLQCDEWSPRGDQLARIIRSLPFTNNNDSTDRLIRRAHRLLSGFDGVYNSTTVAPILIESVRLVLLNKIRRSLGWLSGNIRQHYLPYARTPIHSLHLFEPDWLTSIFSNDAYSNIHTNNKQSAGLKSRSGSIARSALLETLAMRMAVGEDRVVEELLRTAVVEAFGWIDDEFGTDVKKWQWGRVHLLTYTHPLQNFPIFGDVLSGSGTQSTGSEDSISNNGFGEANYFRDGRTFFNDGAPYPRHRMIIDSRGKEEIVSIADLTAIYRSAHDFDLSGKKQYWRDYCSMGDFPSNHSRSRKRKWKMVLSPIGKNPTHTSFEEL